MNNRTAFIVLSGDTLVMDLGGLRISTVPFARLARARARAFTLMGTLRLRERISKINKNKQGLETPTPFLQLGDLVFQGIHAETLGTELVFDDAGGGKVFSFLSV
jgi:hypothetical protein